MLSSFQVFQLKSIIHILNFQCLLHAKTVVFVALMIQFETVGQVKLSNYETATHFKTDRFQASVNYCRSGSSDVYPFSSYGARHEVE